MTCPHCDELRDAIREIVESLDVTYEAYAPQQLMSKNVGTARVWCDEHSCWLYPGEAIIHIDREHLARLKQLAQAEGGPDATR